MGFEWHEALEQILAKGKLHYEVVASKLVEAYQAAQPEAQSEPGDLKTLALANIPLDFCSATDPFVQCPVRSKKRKASAASDMAERMEITNVVFLQNDDFVVKTRQRMQWHAEQFSRRSTNSQLLQRYLRSATDWASQKETAQIFGHAFHVAAWFSFASNVDLAVCQELAELLMKMLQFCHQEPTPRLRVALQVAKEKLQDAEAAGYVWSAKPLDVIQGTLARASSRSHGAPSGGLKRTVAPPGTHGRTDVALVRQVLGPNRSLPQGYRIRWDGLAKRWSASFRGKTLSGSNAAASRFTDEAAIEHIYEVCTKHAAHWPALPWNP